MFPVSVSAGVYGVGKGNGGILEGELEVVTSIIADDLALLREFGQAGAEGGGADAAEFAQLLNRSRLVQLSQSLADAFQGRALRVGDGEEALG